MADLLHHLHGLEGAFGRVDEIRFELLFRLPGSWLSVSRAPPGVHGPVSMNAMHCEQTYTLCFARVVAGPSALPVATAVAWPHCTDSLQVAHCTFCRFPFEDNGTMLSTHTFDPSEDARARGWRPPRGTIKSIETRVAA